MTRYRYTVTFDSDHNPDEEDFTAMLAAAYVQIQDADIRTANVQDDVAVAAEHYLALTREQIDTLSEEWETQLSFVADADDDHNVERAEWYSGLLDACERAYKS